MGPPIPKRLSRSLADSPVTTELFVRWSSLHLPDCWIVAGAVVQSYWNTVHGFEPLRGLRDVDIVYFDADDLTEESETEQEHRIRTAFADLPITLDVKNEARVYLWYESRFGQAIDAYSSVKSAIDTFPTTAGSIGIRPRDDGIDCYASFGFDDLLDMTVRPNKRQASRSVYADKVERWRRIWPLLNIVDWDDG